MVMVYALLEDKRDDSRGVVLARAKPRRRNVWRKAQSRVTVFVFLRQ